MFAVRALMYPKPYLGGQEDLESRLLCRRAFFGLLRGIPGVYSMAHMALLLMLWVCILGWFQVYNIKSCLSLLDQSAKGHASYRHAGLWASSKADHVNYHYVLCLLLLLFLVLHYYCYYYCCSCYYHHSTIITIMPIKPASAFTAPSSVADLGARLTV